MSGLQYIIIFFQCWNMIGLALLLRYSYTHRQQSLTGFTEFAGMTASLLLSTVFFSASLLTEFSRYGTRLFSAGIALYLFAHAFYTLMAFRMFAVSRKKMAALVPLLLVVPLFFTVASFIMPGLFFPLLPRGVLIRRDLSVTPVLYAAFFYVFFLYVVTIAVSIFSREVYLFHNRTTLTLAVLLPFWLPTSCVLLETLFPRQVLGIASAAHCLLPLIVSYTYWGYFASSRRSMVEQAGAFYVVFDVFGACADSNYACRKFFKERDYTHNDITIRTLSNLTGISISELLTMQSRIFHIENDKEHRYYQIERFTARLPYISRVNGTGYWIKDITVHKEKEQELMDLVDKDPLTNVYSRRYFYSYFDQLKNSSPRTGKNMTILMLDIDHFKRVNDSYGHQAGDEVLREVCRRAENCHRTGDILCRFGGEEFILLLHTPRPEDGREIADRILSAMADEDFVLQDGEHIRVTVSIGGAFFVLAGNSRLPEIIQEADEKLYFAKRNNRNQVVF